MTEIKLEPCPFCGASEITALEVHYDGVIFYVSCDLCEASSSGEDTKEEAVEVWNRVSRAVHHSTELAP